MCGLSGEINFDGRPADAGAVQRMTDALSPRGPDGSGIVMRGPVGLGHRRLKIIDLSEKAQQPMVDADLGVTLAFNGCIYNYPELREELIGMGFRFFSHGDTEVIIKAWKAWGEACVDRFKGMFAFVMHERDTGRTVIARDRFGIKPLYLAEQGKRLRFASTLPALLAAGDVDRTIDPVGLHHYMTFHAVVPPPHTLLKGVKKFPPATLRVIEADGTARDRLYWQPDMTRHAEDASLSAEDWRDRVLNSLRAAVKRRMVADVPVGVLLSGGVDSSLIVGLLAELGQTDLMTFSVGPGTIGAMSEPMVSYDNVGFYLLSQEVSKHIKVVQSGQGADEVFAGYHWYPPMLETNDPVETYARAFFDRSHVTLKTQLNGAYMADTDVSRALVEAHFAQGRADTPVDQALRLDSQVMLVDDPVKRVDNMTMAWGLEARVPFLDHELVELAGRIPPEHKLAQGGKGVLKEAARLLIPSEVIDRKKGYFPVPALKYIQGPYLDMVREALTNQAARDRGLFDPEYLDTLFADPTAHITPLRGSELWQVAVLEMWMQQHGV
ncbi:MAG: asparagine synthase (glutamine-hydrolyzing) [Brevundimonas subvibrioides]|uniref:asparagine synthase (glutamine-hydrolyzing) n=1 Tax=Brevundimonas subvibrioides TaxID=74313 RepID=A0A258FVU7_9CAUL|nr:MAG: asparagine synthase (glutamine-hydrolyzing) [Brevundimonas subvibrioides]